MNTSIVLTGMHSIGVDSTGRFMVKDTKVSIKDVPFVRYRFTEYSDDELIYIEVMKKKFNYSSHMIEITLTADTKKIMDKVKRIENLIKFVYIPIDDSDVMNGISEEKIRLLQEIDGEFFDRLMIKDNSNTLDAIGSIRLKKQLSELVEMEYTDIGVCSSPLSFDGKNACLTAVKARELSAEYAESDEVALPSANHECMNTCGCIRYHVFETSVIAPVNKGNKGTIKEGSKTKTVRENKTKGFVKW